MNPEDDIDQGFAWLDTLSAVKAWRGNDRTNCLVDRLVGQARAAGVHVPRSLMTAYNNTIAAEVAHGQPSLLDARPIPSVACTDLEVVWAPRTEEQCKAEGIKIGKAVFPPAASGRATASGRDEGRTKLLFDDATHPVVGGGIVGTDAGDLISEFCLAIGMGCEPTGIGKTIHPHPTLGESIGMTTAELFEGVCTDLQPQKKK